jgi:16S rRNA processing protein RimM
VKGDARIEIGGIARAHGIRGEVAIHTHDPDSTVLERAESIWIDGIEHRVVEARSTPKGWLVALAGLETRNEAEALRGRVVEVARETLELDDGDVLLHDLIGLKVQHADGHAWGEIANVEADFQDRLVIHHDGQEYLLPLVDELVTNIDLEAGVVTVVIPDGLPSIPIPKSRS